MTALSVKNLTKSYAHFCLDRVSFTVEEGRIVGLIGRNGAGKSTTINGILRLISAQGSVQVFGKEFKSEENEIKQKVGYVGGGFAQYPLKKLSVIRKIYASFYPAWNVEEYGLYLKKFGLDENKRVRELSEGMKVKFSLALALSHGALLLVMDEPTSGLDPVSREEFCDIVLSLVRGKGVSVLFSTHITSDLMRIADGIVYISDGKILLESSLKALLCKYALVRFSTAEAACRASAIGVKSVKDGFEGLLPRSSVPPEGAAVSEASLDQIMIHLEESMKEKNTLC